MNKNKKTTRHNKERNHLDGWCGGRRSLVGCVDLRCVDLRCAYSQSEKRDSGVCVEASKTKTK